MQSQPSIGVKKVLGQVKLNFPSLSCGAKEVRMALQELKRPVAEEAGATVAAAIRSA
jgi:hypothetical protein